MRNSKKNRRGIAIELAILTLAITAIFCTIAVTTTLQESKFIKAELEDLDERCVELKYEKLLKTQLKKPKPDVVPSGTEISVDKDGFTMCGKFFEQHIEIRWFK